MCHVPWKKPRDPNHLQLLCSNAMAWQTTSIKRSKASCAQVGDIIKAHFLRAFSTLRYTPILSLCFHNKLKKIHFSDVSWFPSFFKSSNLIIWSNEFQAGNYFLMNHFYSFSNFERFLEPKILKKTASVASNCRRPHKHYEPKIVKIISKQSERLPKASQKFQ